ncbi:hypothetical protein E0H26_00245 [Micromonospora zingiberis]|uniref:Leucine-binding protein domain-containing protein n=1 Tax=Micromonospora zingiberis TaxID=2053011 RepID=A0A4R0GQU0_9ACTN|nr:hypothetical protein [Micromonospora zingiberis]TCC00175.1 hypothetical protein E0H26_00245 [Micromonospora zingiberis]
MSYRERPVRFLLSLLTTDIVVRLAAVVLAGLIVVRVLFAGADGFLSIVLVLAASVLLWGLVWLSGKLRSLLTRTPPEPGDWLSTSRVASFLTTRSRSRLAAVLALLILVVHAGITGYVSVWTILVAIALAAIATVLSPDLRLVALLGGTAVVFAAATVFLASAFSGSTEARALAVSVAGVVLPVLVSSKIGQAIKRPALTVTHHIVLASLTLTLSFLGWTREDWLPGVMQRCYTLPTSNGITFLRASAEDGRCYGLLDTADPGVFATAAFGGDPVTVELQRQILAKNRPQRDDDLTVVWLGSLSCDPLPTDKTRCADGRDYPSERDQLRALLLMQEQMAPKDENEGGALHVVIADATQDVRHADEVAKIIVERERELGPRRVVIGGGDSRDVTQRAINRLLDAGIPFIAPNLLADLGAPGKPFVDRDGYLQLAPPNLEYAKDTVARLQERYRDGFRLDIYQHVEATDQYTTSLVNDLLTAVRTASGASARHLASLDRIDETACTGSSRQGPPTALYFADRWTRFADFVRRVNEVCGHSQPQLVIADVSVSRFMANHQLRAVSNADWPVNFYVSGPGCMSLPRSTYELLRGQVEEARDRLGLRPGAAFECLGREQHPEPGKDRRACTLDASAKLTSQPCEANDLGTYLIPTRDAVLLADALVFPDPSTSGLDGLYAAKTWLSTGAAASVTGGRLDRHTIDVLMWHADALYDPTSVVETPSEELRLPDDPATGLRAQ